MTATIIPFPCRAAEAPVVLTVAEINNHEFGDIGRADSVFRTLAEELESVHGVQFSFDRFVADDEYRAEVLADARDHHGLDIEIQLIAVA